MKFLKNENGMTRVKLTIAIIAIMILVAFSLFLAIGEEGISLRLKRETNTNMTTSTEVLMTNVTNEIDNEE